MEWHAEQLAARKERETNHAAHSDALSLAGEPTLRGEGLHSLSETLGAGLDATSRYTISLPPSILYLPPYADVVG
jgi:hypothetical protein